MTQYKVADLCGALLDAAVAECGEWKTAHAHFPTMTLDSTFSGWFIITDSIGETHCMLQPNNPMRQDPRYFSPSTDWAIGGPIIQRERIAVAPYERVTEHRSPMILDWCASVYQESEPEGFHIAVAHEPLIAAMRSYVIRKLGETVELHD